MLITEIKHTHPPLEWKYLFVCLFLANLPIKCIHTWIRFRIIHRTCFMSVFYIQRVQESINVWWLKSWNINAGSVCATVYIYFRNLNERFYDIIPAEWKVHIVPPKLSCCRLLYSLVISCKWCHVRASMADVTMTNSPSGLLSLLATHAASLI